MRCATACHTSHHSHPSPPPPPPAGIGAGTFAGDNGPATAAILNQPRHVFAEAHDTLGTLISDTSNHRVRRVWPNGTITALAGIGTAGYSGDGGSAVAAQLNGPRAAVWYGSSGAVAVVEGGSHILRVVWANGTIGRLAGAPATSGLSHDCTANAARFSLPEGLAYQSSTGQLW